MFEDLKKTFDKIDWDDIKQTLDIMGSNECRKILQQCYATLSFSILVEGDLMTRFASKRGLRQGGPYLLVTLHLTMENLTQLLELKI